MIFLKLRFHLILRLKLTTFKFIKEKKHLKLKYKKKHTTMLTITSYKF